MSNLRSDFVNLALSRVGVNAPTGDDEFIRFYNTLTGSSFSVDGTPWCAIFVTFNARSVNIATSIIPTFASCTWSRDKFWIPKNRWKWAGEYTPITGDLIYFNWGSGTRLAKRKLDLNHVGIVEKTVGNTVYTIEGNTKGDSTVYGVRHKTYSLDSNYIMGYGVPDIDAVPTSTIVTSSIITYTQAYQKYLNSYAGISIQVDGSFGPATKNASNKAIQMTLNKDYGANLSVDGSFGPASVSAVKPVYYGSNNTLVMHAQGILYGKQLNPKGLDGSFGPGMLAAIINYQSTNGLVKDGICGPKTWSKLCS